MTKATRFIKRHNDGSVWAKGWMLNGKVHGNWTWFRENGTKMRFGKFESGKQIGDWITYDNRGQIFKVTNFDKENKRALKEYYSTAPKSSLKQLQALRRTIKSTIGKNFDEILAYEMPHLRYRGQRIVAIGGFKNHVSLFPLGRIKTSDKEIKKYQTSVGTIQFPIDKPLPVALIRKIILLRVKEATKH